MKNRNSIISRIYSGLNFKDGDWECSVPALFGRGSEMEIGNFEVVSKIF
ncbi:hypothetical protein RM545_07345 [Zunongwangia sp. F260]|uniref:Uncharacterized protein n=1 Tax=Autumnicola lenta TaxID=3075593 RepID=A0ABU3CJH2_9FLAO|nr:hypothetical protein [Zunongwangia sp. F260]MDT0646499.1 hypothetical protein [Zunongwangia sp. F260]